jgi:serine/threonine-protein kinase
MATVFLAHDLKHDRPVALKLLHPELAAVLGPDRFEREIRLAARLQHPHILTVHDSGEAAGQLWFTMPFVEGESLRDRLNREKQLPVEDALRIAREAALGLDYAHLHGVVHRDIKPENLLLTTDGSTMVADFGIARALGGREAQLTESGLVVGTPAYMSPEQAAGDRTSTRAPTSTRWAACCTSCSPGNRRSPGPTAQAILAKRFGAPAPLIRVVRETVPLAVERAIDRALAKSPADRFGTAGEFAKALSEPGAAPRRRSPVAVRRWGVAVGLAALTAAGVLLFRSRPAAPTDPNLLAVAPFDVLDPSLQVWHEGLVDILSRTSTAPDHCAPSRRRWESGVGTGRADRVSAESFGHRTGAGPGGLRERKEARDTVSLQGDGAGPGQEASGAGSRGQR